MSPKKYNPAKDPGVLKLEEMREAGATEKELLEFERTLLVNSDNGPKDTDPPPEEEGS